MSILRISALLFLLVVGQSGMVLAEGIPTSPKMEITFRDQLISAELVDTPLIDVLQRIQQEFGFKAHFHGDLSEQLTLSFVDMPLMKCLQQLTINQSLSVATRSASEVPELNEAKQIAEIWVLSRSGKAQTPGIAAAPAMPGPGDSETGVDAVDGSFGQAGSAQVEKASADQPVNPQNRDAGSKQEIITKLAAVGDPASVMAMADFTHDVDKEVRQLSVSALGSVDSVESTHILGQVLSDESDAEIRMIAVQALGRRQSEMTARTFLEVALDDPDAGVKTLARQLLEE